MRIQLDWLSDHVDVPAIAKLSQHLIQAGAEIEHMYDPNGFNKGVVVARIDALTAHPQASRLQVCRVFDGAQHWNVVCGAPNVAIGQHVALARVGAVLADMRITRRTLRGVESEGMLCARSELGLASTPMAVAAVKDDGIWVLDGKTTLGKNVFDEANVTPVLTLGITPNRPDLLSHLGIAREIAAFSGKRAKATKGRAPEKGPDIGSLARVIVEDTASCKRYVGRVVRGLRVGPSPPWLVERLQSIGQRSINNVVDCTNYVMQDLGLPMHAFDLSRLAVEAGLPTVHVRRARAGETLRTLDGVDRKLDPEDLVIADANRPVALAGVMGGAETEVTQGTVSVFLEAAHFDPARIRGAAKRHQLRTESSLRFGRGADIGIAIKAVDRCAQLLAEVANGEVAKGHLETTQKVEAGGEIALRLGQVPRILGITLTPEALVQLLEPLHIRCINRTERALIFAAPSFRPDIVREVDLLEEIARCHGYDAIADRLPNASGDFIFRPPACTMVDKVRHALLALGFDEAVTYGFGSPSRYELFAAQQGALVRITNPLGEEYSAMRNTLAAGLLDVLARNQQRGAKHVRLFEVGTTFCLPPPSAPAVEGPSSSKDAKLPVETQRVACVLYGGLHGGRWYEKGEQVQFADLAGALEQVAQQFGFAASQSLVPHASCATNPYCTAAIRVGNRHLGWAGALDPRFLKEFGLVGPVFVAEISLTAALQLKTRQIRYKALTKFPSIRRDIALIGEKTLRCGDLLKFLRDHAAGDLDPEVVERVWLFDVYTGQPLSPSQTASTSTSMATSRKRSSSTGLSLETFMAWPM